MKIAHVGNPYNEAWVIAQEQNRRGHEAKVFNIEESLHHYSENLLSGLDRMRMNWKQYDVIVCHDCTLMPGKMEDHFKVKPIYWHHGYGVPVVKEPDFCSQPDMAAYLKAEWIPFSVNLEMWKSRQDGVGECKLDNITEIPWFELSEFLDRYERFYQWDGNKGYSYLAAQAMALNKPIMLQGIDTTIYPLQPHFLSQMDAMMPRKHIAERHDATKVVNQIEEAVRRWQDKQMVKTAGKL